MRITNVRRGRIARVAGICAVLLLLLYALHSWSSENVVVSNEINVEPHAEYYTSHRGVYPELRTGKREHMKLVLKG